MARLDYSATGDVVGQFLPNVYNRRVTLESTGGAGARDQISVTVDLDIHDRLDNDGMGIIVSAKTTPHGTIVNNQAESHFLNPGARGPRHRWYDQRDDLEASIFGALRLGMLAVMDSKLDGKINQIFKIAGNIHNPAPTALLLEILYGEHIQTMLDRDPNDPNQPIVNTLAKTLSTVSRELPDLIFQGIDPRGDGRQYLETIDHHKAYDRDNNIIHKIPYSWNFEIPADTQYLAFHAFTYLNFDALSLDHIPAGDPNEQNRDIRGLSTEDENLLNNMYGRPIRNKVLQNGRVNPHNRVYFDHKGTPWAGTVHRMRDGKYMKGRFHDPERIDPEHYLTVRQVPNTKVQDFRSFSRFEADLYKPDFSHFLEDPDPRTFLESKRKGQFPASAVINYEPGRDVPGGHAPSLVDFEFTIDQEHILRENSRFGDLYNFLPNATKLTVLRPRDYFRLVSIKLLRRRVTRRELGVNKLGFPAKDLFDKNDDGTPLFDIGEYPSTILVDTSTGVVVDQLAPLHGVDHAMLPVALSAMLTVNHTLIGPTVNGDYASFTPNAGQGGWLVGTSMTEGKDLITLKQELGDRQMANFAGNIDPSVASPDLFPFHRTFKGVDLSLTLAYSPEDASQSLETAGVYQYGLELIYEDGIAKYLYKILNDLKVQRKHLEKYYQECLIPVTTLRYMEDKSPALSGFGAGGRTAISEEQIGNYNHVTKRFSQRFVDRVQQLSGNPENPEYNFSRMTDTYLEAASIVYADTLSKIRENVIPQPDEAIIHFWPGRILLLIHPINSRPEQISEILKSFNVIESLLENMLGEGRTYPGFGVQDKRTGLKDRGSAPPQTIKVKKWFSDMDDFVDLATTHEPVADYGLGLAAIEVSEFSYAEQDPDYVPPPPRGGAGTQPVDPTPLAGTGGRVSGEEMARLRLPRADPTLFFLWVCPGNGQTDGFFDSDAIGNCPFDRRVIMAVMVPNHIAAPQWYCPDLADCFRWPGPPHRQWGRYFADLDGDGIMETSMLGPRMNIQENGLYEPIPSGTIFYADLFGPGDHLHETILVFERHPQVPSQTRFDRVSEFGREQITGYVEENPITGIGMVVVG